MKRGSVTGLLGLAAALSLWACGSSNPCAAPTPLSCDSGGACCPDGLPYYCSGSGTCYDSTDQAEDDCGNSYATCK